MSVDTLLEEGITSGAYLNDKGWIHQGLVNLSNKYDLKGEVYDLSSKSLPEAFNKFTESLKKGPVIASVHYTFDPQNPIPHLVVINRIDGNNLYYNDPAETSGGKIISTEDFMKAWKKRYIVILPDSLL
ncbi:C39 family peptidase [Patescibacteria group bacterium]|nr:C39 family peptidase [Patescibacteria group bacterium]